MAGAITIQDVYNEIKKIEKEMITKEELKGILETVEIVSNPETMRQIKESEEDIKAGRVKEVHSVKDILEE